ncbi:hypothetical protein C8A05DRAFT_11493 [Staphylotrichum tortipilum]|uniref:Heterokaryon incompatibility domain-containing protein n=1 Tax=Staphylotrichum tortipilum TaxID=2831512 RepID=A0AAN6MTG1_9PEZI|nr:hypothetical protein C8A05DRAFT_11493 [Staphylotrichum longicolle]
MRLLDVNSFQFKEFFYAKPPPYAILSHTWGSDSEEVSYRDVLDGRLSTPATRPAKITGCCKKAKEDGYDYVWVDTCCIDKTNSVELQEAINSMFRWYRDAEICYAYLSDVTPVSGTSTFNVAFAASRWFQRGWTLQELLAPLNLRFYNKGWTCVGTKGDLCDLVEEITGIPTSFLLGMAELQQASVAQRMSWAAKRVTKRQEDMAYCLLGIFAVYIPMIYGEGDKAFRRLQEQIMKEVGDDSILAWDLEASGWTPACAVGITPGTALAPAPSFFANSGKVTAVDRSGHSFDIQGSTIRLPVCLFTTPAGEIFGVLKCGPEGNGQTAVAIPLAAAPGGHSDTYFRVSGRQALLTATTAASATTVVRIQLDGRQEPSQGVEACWFHIRKSVPDLELIRVDPGDCWHKERALIEATVEPAATKIIIARFRQTTAINSADFVAVLSVDAQADPRCHLMIASRDTSTKEIAARTSAWKSIVADTTSASNFITHLSLSLESLPASPSQRRFILKTVALPERPDTTVNVTLALELNGAITLLDDFRRMHEFRNRDIHGLQGKLADVKRAMADKHAELEEVQAKIEALKKEEARLTGEHELKDAQEQQLLAEYRRLKKGQVHFGERIADVGRIVDMYKPGTRDQASRKHNDPFSKVASQILPYAIRDHHASLTRALLASTTDFSALDLEGRTPLTQAVLTGSPRLVLELLDKGADVRPADQFGRTYLHLAASLGHVDIARTFLTCGAKVSWLDKTGLTPLHVAANQGSEAMVRLLLQHGASATAVSLGNLTPQDLATRAGHEAVAKLLAVPELGQARSRPRPTSTLAPTVSGLAAVAQIANDHTQKKPVYTTRARKGVPAAAAAEGTLPPPSDLRSKVERVIRGVYDK